MNLFKEVQYKIYLLNFIIFSSRYILQGRQKKFSVSIGPFILYFKHCLFIFDTMARKIKNHPKWKTLNRFLFQKLDGKSNRRKIYASKKKIWNIQEKAVTYRKRLLYSCFKKVKLRKLCNKMSTFINNYSSFIWVNQIVLLYITMFYCLNFCFFFTIE